MQVVNLNQKGEEINLENVKIPKDNIIYQTLKGIYEKGSSLKQAEGEINVRQDHKDSV